MNKIEYFHRKDERNAQMHKEYLSIPDLNRIAEKFELSIPSARNALKKKGVKFPKTALHKKSACHRHMQTVKKMNAQGCSLAEIARRIGTSGRHVHRFLRENGLDRYFPTAKNGAEHPGWKGGEYTDSRGYVRVTAPEHPHCSKHTKKVYKHRLVMEKMIGRYLLPDEVVHHKDNDPQNNAPSNLELFSKNSEHLARTLKGKCPNWTIQGIHSLQKSAARRTKKKRTQIHSRLKRDVLLSP